jgi:hypothetical protein
MLDFTKLAAYLDSFDKEDPSYDLVSFIKDKIAQDFKDPETINNGDEQELEDNDITTATPEQQSSENVEGDLMDGAFKELEVLNQIKEQKEQVLPESKLQSAETNNFAGGIGNQKEGAALSLFDLLQAKLTK